MDDIKFSICLPTFNSGDRIGATLSDILAQSYRYFEVIVSDNASTDDTERVVRDFKDDRVQYFRNEHNVGYAQNLNLCAARATGDVLFLMSAKSRLSREALRDTRAAFLLSDDIGAVTRPYYWFGKDIDEPVRSKSKPSAKSDMVISNRDSLDVILEFLKTLDNPAGLAFRRKYIDRDFHEDPFVEFVYPFISIFKKHKIVFLNNYTMACPALTYSGSQNPMVYKKSPMQCWIDLFETVFYEDEFKDLKKACIRDFVAVNYVGLAQVKNYSSMRNLSREIALLVKYRPLNVLNPFFWIFSLGALLTPRFILKKVVCAFKKKINVKFLRDVKLGG